MVDVCIVTEISKEANWNRQTGGQVDAQDQVLSHADVLTENNVKRNVQRSVLARSGLYLLGVCMKIYW